MPVGVEALFIFLAVLVLAGLGIWRRYVLAGRQRALMLLCHRAGLEFMPVDPFPDTPWRPFALFGKGVRRGIENVVWDPRDDDAEVRAFDLWYQEESSNEGPGVIRRFSCVVADLPFGCPRLDVVPHGRLEVLLGVAPLEDVELELEEFNRRFRVVSSDRYFATAFLDARMMAALMRLPVEVALSINEDGLLLWAPLMEPGAMVTALEVARSLRERVPRVVRSLYPPRPATSPFEARWMQGHWSPDPTSAVPWERPSD
jgi:hypothetical protein